MIRSEEMHLVLKDIAFGMCLRDQRGRNSDVGGYWRQDGGGNGNIMYSYDGISWSDSVGGTSFSNCGVGVLLTGPAGTELRCGWLLELTDGNNGNIMYSYDGISWSDSVGGTSFGG